MQERPERVHHSSHTGTSWKNLLCCEEQGYEPLINFRIRHVTLAVEDTHQETWQDTARHVWGWIKEKVWGTTRTYELPGHTRLRIDW